MREGAPGLEEYTAIYWRARLEIMEMEHLLRVEPRRCSRRQPTGTFLRSQRSLLQWQPASSRMRKGAVGKLVLWKLSGERCNKPVGGGVKSRAEDYVVGFFGG
jgi:hypothetical protein